ncbi:probable rRNA-processing protein EBP2 isoform X1 [Ictalurus furcatus]|uniref:probable rRNA-processing protein EBP2 isoform X1 n=1 Tax=Ictalurus furcatus TaxID=66913 RepID=UPI0023506B4D|nr:probable rRNA-processing protein EBP2 isoform X1 [Ictalurus furcatus]XP_053484616.1 probable rRNA-processing protein EBP2 isoform X1 [Ictalurus furcatus]
MSDVEEESQMGAESEEEDSELSDGELQEAFSKGLLKPGMNIPLEEPKKAQNDVEGLKKCLAEFKRNMAWVERLDLTTLPAANIVDKVAGRTEPSQDVDEINADDDFQREMYFYRQAQASVLKALPKLKKLKIPTKRPDDYFAEMAKSDQHMQKIRKKLIQKQMAMEKSEKAKKLREQRKYGKKVQVEVLQKRQKEKKSMMTAVKKYQKGMTDKLDFLEGDAVGKKAEGAPSKPHVNKKGPNSKRKYKDSKFGFGGRKKGSKWNTKESHNDVSGFRAKVAHGKAGKKFSKGGKKNKRPGKEARRKMKSRK